MMTIFWDEDEGSARGDQSTTIAVKGFTLRREQEAIDSMSAFATPIQPLRRGRVDRAGRCSIRCALIKGGSGGRRRRQTPSVKEAQNLDGLPPAFISEVRRLVQSTFSISSLPALGKHCHIAPQRKSSAVHLCFFVSFTVLKCFGGLFFSLSTPGRSFLQQVKETLQWPYVRYTGILFQKPAISLSNVDGIPEHFRYLHRRPDYKFIDIPPGLTLRASRKCKGLVDNVRLCALFEAYGIDGEHLRELQDVADEIEKDDEKQIQAWSDVGQAMRTETDLMNKTGPEIYVEDHRDLYQ